MRAPTKAALLKSCRSLGALLDRVDRTVVELPAGGGQPLERWLSTGLSAATYSLEIVPLSTAAHRLYPKARATRWADGITWGSWDAMREVYRRTKGEPFVIEPSPGLLTAIEATDMGPLFVWVGLWHFAGCPKMDEDHVVLEKPTWKARPLREGTIPFFPASPWVQRLRAYAAGAAEGRPRKVAR